MTRFLGRGSMLFALALLASVAIVMPVWSAEEVPFKASLALQGSLAGQGKCPAGLFQFDIIGGGVVSHMGATTDVQSHCFNFQSGAVTEGTYTFTAANGDTISGGYTAELSPTAPGVFAIDGQFTITGGTGRFTGATGGGAASGVQYANGEASLTLAGSISSVGSNR